jgi:hypothetical protein
MVDISSGVQKSLVHMRHSEAAWGEALYHQNRRNEQLNWMYTLLDESWISTSFQLPEADDKMTKELKTICSGLRFDPIEPKEKNEVHEVELELPVIASFIEKCFVPLTNLWCS